jgi:hypothetical protein
MGFPQKDIHEIEHHIKKIKSNEAQRKCVAKLPPKKRNRANRSRPRPTVTTKPVMAVAPKKILPSPSTSDAMKTHSFRKNMLTPENFNKRLKTEGELTTKEPSPPALSISHPWIEPYRKQIDELNYMLQIKQQDAARNHEEIQNLKKRVREMEEDNASIKAELNTHKTRLLEVLWEDKKKKQ